jgi:hypothetical protein
MEPLSKIDEAWNRARRVLALTALTMKATTRRRSPNESSVHSPVESSPNTYEQCLSLLMIFGVIPGEPICPQETCLAGEAEVQMAPTQKGEFEIHQMFLLMALSKARRKSHTILEL